MKTYTTIFLDVDNIAYELYNNRYMHSYSRQMVEQILKKGIRSLQDFEVVGLLGKTEKFGRNYISKNRLENIKSISREVLRFNKSNHGYLEYLLKRFNKNKKEVLVVSGNSQMLASASILGIDTCYFNLFSDKSVDTKVDMTVNKLEELRQYRLVKKQLEETKEDSKDTSSNYHYYIDANLLKILEENKITLNQSFDTNKYSCLNSKLNGKIPFIITEDLTLVRFFKEQGCMVYFVNNHCNDCIDYVADYESLIEDLPKQLEKIMNK